MRLVYNILAHISDHFPQLAILNKVSIDNKSCPCAKHGFPDLMNMNLLIGFLSRTWISLKIQLKIPNLTHSTKMSLRKCTKMSKKDIKLHEKPWFTPKIQRLILIDLYTNSTKNVHKMVKICLKSYKIGLLKK